MSNYKGEVEIVNGYYLPDMFSVVIPEATENLITNPSVETNTTGYTAQGAGVTIARINTQQRRGVYALQINAAAGVASGAYFASVTTVQNQPYTFSLDVKGVAGHWYNAYFASAAGAQLGIAKRWQANGYWQRVSISYNENAAGAARRLYLVQDSSNTQPFYTDGWQVENKAYPTTYTDGDQVGFVIGEVAYGWTSTYHGSTSFRNLTTRSGGRVMNLKDYGYNIISSIGLGLAPVLNYSLPSNLGGAYYQNTVNDARGFSLVGDIIQGNNLKLAGNRADLENALAFDVTPYRQPLLLHFQEKNACGIPIGDEIFIKCLYEGGMERTYDNMNGEKLILQFTAFDRSSVWIDGNYAKALLYNKSYAYNNILKLSYDGVYSTFGTGANNTVYCSLTDALGNLYIGGTFTTINGVAANGIAIYSGGVWSALGAGVTGGALPAVTCMELRDGLLYVGGGFTTAGGGAAANIAIWNTVTSAWSAMGAGLTGGANPACYTIFVNQDHTYVYAGGLFTTAGGVACANIARWGIVAGAWGALAMGGANGCNDSVGDIISNDLLSIYCGGIFTTSGGVTTNKIAKWFVSGTWQAMGTGITGDAYRLAYTKNQELLVGGSITFASGIPCKNMAIWNGSSWRGLFCECRVYDLVIDKEGIAHAVGASGNDPGQPAAADKCAVIYQTVSLNSTDAVSRAHTYRLFGGNGIVDYGIGFSISIDATGAIVIGGVFKNVQSGYLNSYENIIPQFPQFNIDNVGNVNSCLPMTIETIYDEEGISFFRTLAVTERSKLTGYQWVSNFGIRTPWLSKSGSAFQLDTGLSLPIHVLAAHTYTETGDNNNQLNLWWMITGQTILNTNGGQLSASIVADGAGFYHVDFFKAAARGVGNLVGHTGTYNAIGLQAVIADNASGLSGYIGISAVTAADVDIEVVFGLLSFSMQYRNIIRSLSKARYA